MKRCRAISGWRGTWAFLHGARACSSWAGHSSGRAAPRRTGHETKVHMRANHGLLIRRSGATIRSMPNGVAASLSDPTLLAAIAQETDDAIFAKDREGRYTFANPAALRIMKLPLEQVIGRTDAD